MKFARLMAAACSVAAMLSGGAASAANYVESISADPSNFSCSTVAGLKTCDAYTLFTPSQPSGASGTYNGGSGFFFANPSDTVTVDVSYSSAVKVPNSKTVSLVYIDLFALTPTTDVGYLPLKTSVVDSVLTNYVGPSGYYFNYLATDYSASAGHYFSSGNPGAFSIDGIDSTFDIIQGNPDIIALAVYGYQAGVPEPSTWAILLLGFGGLGAVLRGRRRLAAAG